MPITEARRQELFTRAVEALGPAAAETMMELIADHHWAELATKDDLRALERHVDERFAATTRTFVTWMLTSQAAVAATVGLVIALAH